MLVNSDVKYCVTLAILALIQDEIWSLVNTDAPVQLQVTLKLAAKSNYCWYAQSCKKNLKLKILFTAQSNFQSKLMPK